MRIHIWGTACLLLVLGGAEVARAENVVVLELSGDKKDKLRGQVERALKRLDKVELLPLARYKVQAARVKLRGAKAMTPAAVAKVSKALRLDAAVGGELDGNSLLVRIYGPKGDELWSKELPLKKGILSAANAFRLAKAVNAAAKMGGKAKPADEAEETEQADEEAEETPVASAPPVPRVTPRVETPAQSEVAQTPETPATDEPGKDAFAESHTVTEVPPDPDLTVEEVKRPKVGPRLITLRLGPVGIWRSYCSRPGADSCAEFDARPEAERQGFDTVSFTSKAPYFGGGGTLELFPFASVNSVVKGLGLGVGYARGFALTSVCTSPDPDPTRDTCLVPRTDLVASDEAWYIQLLPRYYFGLWQAQLTGFVGLRGGLESRNFDVDVSANSPLPGSHRRYWTVGADFSIPLFTRFFRLEGGGSYFFNPSAGAEELAGYGQSVTGMGYVVEAGAGGDVVGPFGYTLRFRMARYKDAFQGAGSKWVSTDRGVAEETYSSATLNVNLQF